MQHRLDIIIFGATGFTGKFCIKKLPQILEKYQISLTWGVAGRSTQKLKQILKDFDMDSEVVPIFYADTSDYESIAKMTAMAKIIVNCCGPYNLHGEAIIRACLQSGTHHVDISGEPLFMEKMQLNYNKIAEEKGTYIVSACGLDSTPSDLMVQFLQKHFKGALNSVEIYVEIQTDESVNGPSFNYTTWRTFVNGVSEIQELRRVRKELFNKKLTPLAPKIELKKQLHKSNDFNVWAVPFVGSDRSVIVRTQRFLWENENLRPVQVQIYTVCNSIVSGVLTEFATKIITMLTTTEWGRKLLLQYPRLFSGGMFTKEPPAEDKIRKTKVFLYFSGKGWKDDVDNSLPNKKVMCTASVEDPGYGFTAVTALLSAIVILTEPDKLPKKGGVFTPGVAFANTTLLDKLEENGLNIQFQSKL